MSAAGRVRPGRLDPPLPRFRRKMSRAPPQAPEACAYPPGIDPLNSSGDPTYGYSRKNPIRVGGPTDTSGPAAARHYLARVRNCAQHARELILKVR
jgi:hypothetical protein